MIYKVSPPVRTGKAARLGLKRLVHFPNTGFAVTQVKEKFGTLRFYTNWTNGDIEFLIHVAEDRSSWTCEYCGAPGKMRNERRWLRTLCNDCNRKEGAR